LVTSTDHPLARKRSITVQELLEQPLVLREEGSGTRAAALKALAAACGKRELANLRVSCEVGSTEACKAAVRAGLGVSFVSSLAIKDELAGKHLATTAVKGFDVRRAFHLVTRAEPLLSPAARAFRLGAFSAA
ncbi:MAG: LysR substrate-binding domain-containing protein, partial [Planctomycetota bacterium]